MAIVALPACKDKSNDDGTPSPDGSGDDVVAARSASETERYAADYSYLQTNSTFYQQLAGEPLSRRLSDLPATGDVAIERRPMSGGYYAEPDGGLDQIVSGSESPVRKYDRAFYGDGRATTWERQNHVSSTNWAGHCNGYAAAAQRHPKEPEKAVVRNGVTFSRGDIKALLAEIHMTADYLFLGGDRCESRVPPSNDRPDPTVMDKCLDTNPGTLHAALANWVGRLRHTVIIDTYAGDQVWNHPVAAYRVTQNNSISSSQAAQILGKPNYIFNPNATKFAHIKLTLTTVEILRKEALGQFITKPVYLEYILELDNAGDILGGEWVGTSVREHPDFIWLAFEPITPNGTKYMGNPHISSAEVIKMWAESINADPSNPPLDFKRPPLVVDWGRWPNFTVTIDGSTRGAVFSGKPIKTKIERRDVLQGGGLTLDVQLNGTSLTQINLNGNEGIEFTAEPGPGLNRFQFIWKKGATIVEDQFLRFYVQR
jgi:hypothetical protein